MTTIHLLCNRRNLHAAVKKFVHYDDSMCETTEVPVTVEIDHEKDTVKITEGCVTGFESFHISDLLRRNTQSGMYWCVGTPGLWDSLFMPQPQVDVLLKALKEKAPV